MFQKVYLPKEALKRHKLNGFEAIKTFARKFKKRDLMVFSFLPKKCAFYLKKLNFVFVS